LPSAPYPQELIETLDWHGETLTLRPIRPEDEAQHLAFLQKMDPEDIRLRIFYSRRSIEHSELARLTQIDYDREMAFIATRTGPDGQPETIGVVRGICDPGQRDGRIRHPGALRPQGPRAGAAADGQTHPLPARARYAPHRGHRAARKQRHAGLAGKAGLCHHAPTRKTRTCGTSSCRCSPMH
jgi:hypothetical protein